MSDPAARLFAGIMFGGGALLLVGILLAASMGPAATLSVPIKRPDDPCIQRPCVPPPNPNEGPDAPPGIWPPYPDEPRYKVCYHNPMPKKC